MHIRVSAIWVRPAISRIAAPERGIETNPKVVQDAPGLMRAIATIRKSIKIMAGFPTNTN
jgi:hypothetical protein